MLYADDVVHVKYCGESSGSTAWDPRLSVLLP